MRRLLCRLSSGFILTAVLAESGMAQKALTWQEVRERFEKSNPTLLAGQVGVEEFKASEITAYLRPNPNLTLSADGTQLVPSKGCGSRS
jgi:cobalt-zinc-cadmium efflux system outer membrane protein